MRISIIDYPNKKFVCYTGMETDLIFNKQIDLPCFAAFPLIENQSGRELVAGYYQSLIDFAILKNIGVVLESVTWVASQDRAKPLGYGAADLKIANENAISLMSELRDASDYVPILLSANIGPRYDAYSDVDSMTVEQAENYHMQQISVLAAIEADFITAYTVGSCHEAIGMARAAERFAIPIVISFTVEVDGHLPSGMTLMQAITEVDEKSGDYPLYYMINCTHPEHFELILDEVVALGRLRGLVVNASKCSHAELDEATILDDGNPHELGETMRDLELRYTDITILGGCCGTDLRHLNEMFL